MLRSRRCGFTVIELSLTTASDNWVQVAHRVNGTQTTLSVFYTLAATSSTLTLNWPGSRSHFGTIAHFSTPAGSATLVAAQSASGSGQFAEAPAATAVQDHSLVIRAVAAQGTLQLVEDACKIPGHIAITLRRKLLNNPIVGMAYRHNAASLIPPASFKLADSGNYATATASNHEQAIRSESSSRALACVRSYTCKVSRR